MKIKSILFSGLFLIYVSANFCINTIVYAYDNNDVHPNINERAGKTPFVDGYIKTNLGYQGGVENSFAGKKVWQWLREGGKEEDEPDPRVLRHFHDPTYQASQWNKAGLGLNDSALVWAQEPSQSTLFGGTHSWVTARTSFYNALTTGSEAEYAETFRSLGQVMHLISDMAVPAHVRVDKHFAYIQKVRDPYEDYTAVHSGNYANLPAYPVDKAIFARQVLSKYAPITALWDQDAINNSLGQTNNNPDILWSVDTGLAEFTNANFFSRDTFWEYTHPNLADKNLLYEINWHNLPPVTAKDNKIDSPAYIWRMVDGHRAYRLAAANYFALDTDYGIPNYDKTLDNEVYKDYANILIPRAIGYSAALLDYFFRGNLEIRHIVEKWGQGMTVIGFDFEVKNTSQLNQTIEAFGIDSKGQAGQLALAYEYVPYRGSEPVRGLVENVYTVWTTSDLINSDFVKISVDLARDATPIPSGASEIAFTLIYQGRMGDEDNALAAKRYAFPEKHSRIAYYFQPGGPGNPSNIYSVLPDGSEPLLYTNSTVANGTRFYTPVWSGDGTKMAFEIQSEHDPLTEDYSYNIQVVDPAGPAYPGNFITTLSFAPPDPWGNAHFVSGPTFSPDGSQLAALVTSDSGGWAIIKFDVATGSASYVKGDYRTFWIHKYLAGIPPAWSPKGDRIAYYIEDYQPSRVEPPTVITDIFTINLIDGSDINLTDDGFSMNTQPSWSPDGEWIVFVSDRDGGAYLDIWVMDKDGGSKQKIRECPVNCWNPSFSPDGLQIAFAEGSNIYRIDLGNGGSTQLTNSDWLTATPSWSPYLK